jgi:biopolymer transport protein ExbB
LRSRLGFPIRRMREFFFSSASEETVMEFFSFIRDHFWHAFPILLCGGIAVAITIERFWALFVYLPLMHADAFFDRISGFVMKAQFAEAVKLCEMNKRKPTANVVLSALTRAHLPESVIHDGLQLSLQKATRSIQTRTAYLATIANVATLLGLFGTIAGLIASFEAVGHADAQQKSALLAAGIATAMNATMLGLGVAVPCMIVYAILMNKTSAFMAELEHTAVKSLDIMKQRFYSSELVQSPFATSDKEERTSRKAA